MAGLYQPYLHLSWLEYTSLTELHMDPLQQIKKASQAVESSILFLISNEKTDDIPNWL